MEVMTEVNKSGEGNDQSDLASMQIARQHSTSRKEIIRHRQLTALTASCQALVQHVLQLCVVQPHHCHLPQHNAKVRTFCL